MRKLNELRSAINTKHQIWLDAIARNFPGRDQWDWYRACAAADGENVRRNNDQRQDEAMAGNTEIDAAHTAYISALYAFYRARDGEKGVLG